MMKKRLSNIETNERVKREKDPIPWRYCLLSLVLGVLLVGGFFLAARQHFSAMNLSFNNSKLRHQRDSLQIEQRQFHLAKEIALAPAELEKAAQKIGLQKLTASHLDFLTSDKKEVKKPEEKQKAEKDLLWNPKSDKGSDEKLKNKENDTDNSKVKKKKENPDEKRVGETAEKISKNRDKNFNDLKK